VRTREMGYDPLFFPINSVARIAAVIKIDAGFVHEKARDILGRYPGIQTALADAEVPRVVNACRPYMPRDDEAWEAEEDDCEYRDLIERYGGDLFDAPREE